MFYSERKTRTGKKYEVALKWHGKPINVGRFNSKSIASTKAKQKIISLVKDDIVKTLVKDVYSEIEMEYLFIKAVAYKSFNKYILDCIDLEYDNIPKYRIVKKWQYRRIKKIYNMLDTKVENKIRLWEKIYTKRK